MNSSVSLFGSITRAMPPEIECGPFRFCLADVDLQGRASISPLSSVAMRHDEHSPLAETYNAHWVRGRLQKIFGFNQAQDNLDIQSQVGNQSFTDRLMLNTSFSARTIENETLLFIPFLCTEDYAETRLIHGSLPDRNEDKCRQLLASMTHSFVKLLLSANELSEYDDYGIVFGSRFQFGVKEGVPYSSFPGSPR